MNATRLAIGLATLALVSCSPGQRVSAPPIQLLERERLAVADPMADEVHVVFELPDDPSLFAPASPDADLLAYRAAVDRRLPAGHEPSDLLRRGVAALGPLPEYARSVANMNAVLSGVGTLAPMNRLEALLFSEQNRRFPMLSRPTEFHALVLRGHGRVIVYFGTTGLLFAKSRDEVEARVRADVARGYRLVADVHPHPFTFDRAPGDSMWSTPEIVDDIGGALAPSENDVLLYRDARETSGLESAWVVNGFDAVHVGARDFDRLEAASH